MTPEHFAYWLQGFSELSGPTPPTMNQWKLIQEHLALVMTKKTPPLMPLAAPGALGQPPYAPPLMHATPAYPDWATPNPLKPGPVLC